MGLWNVSHKMTCTQEWLRATNLHLVANYLAHRPYTWKLGANIYATFEIVKSIKRSIWVWHPAPPFPAFAGPLGRSTRAESGGARHACLGFQYVRKHSLLTCWLRWRCLTICILLHWSLFVVGLCDNFLSWSQSNWTNAA